jgi:coenzyme F420-0:L-glutamate ligase/coenzyme F420-1:gamma-L-glutamate ligase
MAELRTIRVIPVDGIGEIVEGTDLATVIATTADLACGDIVVVTSKVISKAEGRVTSGDRNEAIDRETVRVVARRGSTTIVENRLGLVMAAAGIDASNVDRGKLVLLPLDPDASASLLRSAICDRTGRDVGVVITDTSGRAWRRGQTDIAIGVAGIEPLESFEGREDGYGNQLSVTEPAVADEVAGIAEVASGKLGRIPVVIVRGLSDRLLPIGIDGPGARSLVRPASDDMFGLGSREAVVAALREDCAGQFGRPSSQTEVLAALLACGFMATAPADSSRLTVDAAADDGRLRALLWAFGWTIAGPRQGSGNGLSVVRRDGLG